MKFCFFILSLTLPALTASANPLNYLKREIKKDGYILYRTPLSASGTGTLVGGTPKAMSIMTDPQTCFPDVIDGEATQIRKIQDTDLGSISRNTDFEGKIALDLVQFMNTGNSVFKIGVGVTSIHSIELQFEGAKVEYIDTILLQEFYQNKMSTNCKRSLNQFGFIAQALRVDKMRYAFRDNTGAYLQLSLEGIKQILDIDLNISYHIEQGYILVIDTPKYIGYQLGRLQEQDNGLALYRSQKTFLNKYIFKSMGIFQH